jgi:hypothetical protein
MSAQLGRPACTALKRIVPLALASLVCLAGCAQPAPKVVGANAAAPTASTADLDGACAFAASIFGSGSPDCTENTTENSAEGQLALDSPTASGFQGVSAYGYRLIDANWLVDMQSDSMAGQQGVLMLDAMQSH